MVQGSLDLPKAGEVRDPLLQNPLRVWLPSCSPPLDIPPSNSQVLAAGKAGEAVNQLVTQRLILAEDSSQASTSPLVLLSLLQSWGEEGYSSPVQQLPAEKGSSCGASAVAWA